MRDAVQADAETGTGMESKSVFGCSDLHPGRSGALFQKPHHDVVLRSQLHSVNDGRTNQRPHGDLRRQAATSNSCNVWTASTLLQPVRCCCPLDW